MVTPFVGVWIEITTHIHTLKRDIVTPFVGVWIEICYSGQKLYSEPSLPSWECGLKYKSINILMFYVSHSLRGSVD